MSEMVSIIVPVYNGEKYINHCVDLLEKQTYKNIEIIMVNDGSKDNTPQILDSYAEKYSNIKVVHQKNTGLPGARDAGIRVATGKYVIFFDVDDEYTETVIEDNVKLAEENQADIVMFCFWYYLVDTDKLKDNCIEKNFIGSRVEFFYTMLPELIDKEIFNAPWNKLIKKSLLDDNGIDFDVNYPIMEDIIFASKVLRVADKIVVNKKMYYKYFYKVSGSLINRFYENYFDCISNYYDNAMIYCSEYENNKLQDEKLSWIYAKLGIMHLKQISCNKELTKDRKYELITKICNDEKFNEALKKVKFDGKKDRMRNWVLEKKVKRIYSSYRILGCFI